MTTRQAKAVQGASAESLGIPVEFTNSVGMKMVYVPPGWYPMGAWPFEEEVDLANRPQQFIVIPKGFYMSHWEVTREQYDTLYVTPRTMAVGREQRFYLRPLPQEFQRQGRASWFLKSLSEKEGRTYRLPTEQEWEYACRAGTVTPYAFGEKMPLGYVIRSPAPALAEIHVDPAFPKEEVPPWWPANWRRSWTWAHRVEEFGYVAYRPLDEVPPEGCNAWGLYHMHGSLWEWCQSPSLSAPPPPYAQPGDDLRENSRYNVKAVARTESDRATRPQMYAEARLRGGEKYCPAEACRSGARVSEHYPFAGTFSSTRTGTAITMGPGTYEEMSVGSSGWTVENAGCRAVCDPPAEAQAAAEQEELASALVPKPESLTPELRQWAESLLPEDLYKAAVSLLADAEKRDEAVERYERLGQADQAERERAGRAALEQKLDAVRCFMVLRLRVPWDRSVLERSLPPEVVQWSKSLPADGLGIRNAEDTLLRQIRSAEGSARGLDALGYSDKAEAKRKEKGELEQKLRAVRLLLLLSP